MCKICWSLSALLLLVILGGAYKFIVQGSTVTSSDGRQAILMNPAERDLVLTEMRGFLTSVQQINQGLAEQDLKLVAKAARNAGSAAVQGVPATLVAKLPLEFKTLGFDTHSKFDQLALDAEQLADASHSLKQLSTLMNNCLSCHQAFRIDPIAKPTP